MNQQCTVLFYGYRMERHNHANCLLSGKHLSWAQQAASFAHFTEASLDYIMLSGNRAALADQTEELVVLRNTEVFHWHSIH